MNINAVLCDKPREVKFSSDDSATSGIVESMTDVFKGEFAPYLISDDGHHSRSRRCQRIGSILQALGIRQIDWWVVDVEGAELDVLRGMDWDAVRVNVLAVEADMPQAAAAGKIHHPKTAEVVALLESKGYLFDGYARRSAWFRRRDFVPSSWPDDDGSAELRATTSGAIDGNGIGTTPLAGSSSFRGVVRLCRAWREVARLRE